MKKHEIIFSTIKVPLDFLIVFISFFIARDIRLITDLIPFIQLPIQTIQTAPLILFALMGGLLYISVLSLHGTYKTNLVRGNLKESLLVLRYSFYWFILYSFILFVGKDVLYNIDLPRLILGFTYIISTIGIIISRYILNYIHLSLTKRGIVGKKKIIFISNKNDSDMEDIIQNIKKTKFYEISGYINTKRTNSQLPYLGSLDEFQSICLQRRCDEVLYINSDYPKDNITYIWELCRIFGITYKYIANSFTLNQANTSLELIYELPVIEIKNTPLQSWGRVIKRIIDIIGGGIITLLISPILIIVAILIKIEDPAGPIIYKNRRVGQNGKLFNLYKFRYMKWKFCTKESYGAGKDDAALEYEKQLIESQSSREGPLYKIENDPRKTKIGTFIEKYSIDELPQFFNVLLGNMSIVGPRPHQPREVEKYELRHKRLLTIKPGVTGMAQVNGRDTNTFEDEAKLDFFYIENWSFLLDLKIFFKTFSVILKRK